MQRIRFLFFTLPDQPENQKEFCTLLLDIWFTLPSHINMCLITMMAIFIGARQTSVGLPDTATFFMDRCQMEPQL